MAIHKLPPLHALHVFETVARLGGVRAAAAELNVTPPAVSHQLDKLEGFLGAPLFIRRGRNLVLTDRARDYLTEVRPSLEAIGRATSVATQESQREVLTIAAPPTLTTMWLMPKLIGFSEQFPEYDIRLLDRMTFNPDERSIDIAIEYRFEPDPDLVSVQFLPDELVPLASASYVAMKDITSLEDLNGATLIETERRLTSWKKILAGRSWLKHQRFFSVSYSLHAFEAAARGIGVALGNRANADRMLAEGRLCIPFELPSDSLPPAPRYFLSAVSHRKRQPRVQAFWDWIMNETQREL
ncbi:LysR substrate-binding domain-containing protein [Cognatishimia activa]|uniref:LysR substrate-binding domain-containing protein n=1 Tax=Cognatishimia activa TaxID=1715691 RepID=UPI00222EA3AA|nr:LysR substrate-binding domain-containing protein [Cognatishimia activa]UZD89745.1 LysR substrate-binding domain-containing protein [Cognatishimia activa]